MSDSAPKQRSFFAAYWPLIATLGVLVLVIAVLFSMRSPDAPIAAPDAAPGKKAAPVMPGDPKAGMERVKKLFAKGNKTWDGLSPADREFFDALTKSRGQEFFEFGVKKLEERASMPKPPLGALTTPPPDDGGPTPPPGL